MYTRPDRFRFFFFFTCPSARMLRPSSVMLGITYYCISVLGGYILYYVGRLVYSPSIIVQGDSLFDFF